MPSSDLVLNVRQVAGYPPTGNAIPSDSLLLQRGLGGAYLSIGPAALVSTALASPGADMAIGGQLQVESVQGGSLQFANGAFGLVDAQQACIVNLNATWGSIGTLNADLASFVQAQITSLGVAGDMQVGGTANMASAVVQTNLTASYANILQTLDAANLNVSNLATVCNLIANGNIAVPQGAITVGGYSVLTTATAGAYGFAPLDSPAFTGNPTAPTPLTNPADNSTSLATTAFVVGVVNQLAGQIAAQFAPLTAPAFNGVPTAPTAAPGSSTGQLATTAFVMNAVQDSTTGVVSFNTRTGAIILTTTDILDAGGAPIQSPAFLGSPVAPTAAPGTNTTQLATCAFVANAIAGLSGYAPINSPAFTGTPTAPTPTTGDSSTAIATTQFVQNTLTSIDAGVVSFNGRAGAVTLSSNDISAAGGAPLGSPALYGVPTAPTAAPGTNTTQLATCAFIQAAIAAISGVASFNGRTGAVVLTAADVTGVVTIPVASTTTPLMNGTAAIGTSASFSRADHVHPSDTSRAPLASPTFTGTPAAPTAAAATRTTQLATTAFVGTVTANYLPLTGGVLTGGLTLPNQVITQGSLLIQVGSATNPTIFMTDGSTNRLGLYFNIATGSTTLTDLYSGASLVMDPSANFTFNGLQAYKGGGGEWGTTSDARIKTVLGDYALGLDQVLRVQPIRYRYRGNDAQAANEPSPHAQAAKAGTEFVGFVAQDIEGVFPEMVSRREGFVDGRKVTDLRDLNASSLVYALVNAVKTLVGRIEQLEARMT
ncbi:MAG TPA: tail fiber domain-containing protein [Stellaceae bacterium]|jgi:hypothetical protein|nr:tail fiber domain-containing protein [Stellaceae bacterium]